MRHRSAIDGLRAVAVIPVVLFHAGIGGFDGGYVGVDVFFVISGYLITGVIARELEAKEFSVVRFYERRARRILPALFLLLFLCLPASLLLATPQTSLLLAKGVVSVSLFFSNILLWRQSGYFEISAQLNPLFHTWSLAVEEQYYLLFPLFMILVWKFGKRWLLVSLSMMLIASLGLAQLVLQIDPDAAFYLLPTRAWELLMGSLAALYFDKHFQNAPAALCELLGILGLGLILIAIVLYEKATPVPGLPALVPTVGTCLLLLCARQGTFTNRILSYRLIAGIGLVSYSAYLIHQALFAFARLQAVSRPSTQLMLGLCLLTFPLAYLSWRFVEIPFRDPKKVSRKAILLFGLAGTTFFVLVGAIGIHTQGYKQIWLAIQSNATKKTYHIIEDTRGNGNFGADIRGRQDDGDCRFNAHILSEAVEKRFLICYSKYGPGQVILGDSHAVDLFGMVTSGNKAPFIVGITRGGCSLAPDSKCFYEEFQKFVKENAHAIRVIVFEQAGRHLIQHTTGKSVTRNFLRDVPLSGEYAGLRVNADNVRKIRNYLGQLSQYVEVIWFGPRLEPHISDAAILRLGCDYPFRIRKNGKEIFASLDAFIRQSVANQKALKFISQGDLFGFEFPRDFMNCKAIYWRDGDHLSAAGEQYFGTRLPPNIFEQ